MKTLGLIPARGGSKRVHRKNLRRLCGQPLVAWSFGAARSSPSIDKLVLSSEDDEIIDLAHQYDIETIRRPIELAQDDTPMYPVIMHALDNAEEQFDYLCLLHPTSPFRVPMDIESCGLLASVSSMPACASAEDGKHEPNGAVYFGRTDWLRDGGNFDGDAVDRYFMPPERSLDIDTEADWIEAERYMHLLGFRDDGAWTAPGFC